MHACTLERRYASSMRRCAAQVYKAFLARCGKFVAIKKINCFERVGALASSLGGHFYASSPPQSRQPPHC